MRYGRIYLLKDVPNRILRSTVISVTEKLSLFRPLDTLLSPYIPSRDPLSSLTQTGLSFNSPSIYQTKNLYSTQLLICDSHSPV